MFYSLVSPENETDRVHLYPSVAEAIAHADDEHRIYKVAVEFDTRARLAMPSWIDPLTADPVWTGRAEQHGDGSITVKGLIPKDLFFLWLWTPTDAPDTNGRAIASSNGHTSWRD
jgi:hypothetical protein